MITFDEWLGNNKGIADFLEILKQDYDKEEYFEYINVNDVRPRVDPDLGVTIFVEQNIFSEKLLGSVLGDAYNNGKNNYQELAKLEYQLEASLPADEMNAQSIYESLTNEINRWLMEDDQIRIMNSMEWCIRHI